jgi:2-keto-4-pentenoate hydratase/2-oxohepta-3-ene-1,7-dioic acid hydratase in catechol pathway
LPAPTHARGLLHDAEWEGTVTIDGAPQTVRGRALAMHLWGNRRVPTLHWIWSPWLGDGSLELTAVSLRDRLSLGLSNLDLDGPHPVHGTPATAAHPHGLITATVAGPRRLIHVHAWAEADELVGYAYRDTDERDLMVAQSDIGSAHYEAFSRRAPGMPWHLTDERRSAGGVAVEIHQRAPLPGVDYIGWNETQRPRTARRSPPPRGDVVDWPALGSIVALGLTYADHVKETGQTVDRSAPPVAFAKHARSYIAGDTSVRVPTHEDLRAALFELEPALADKLAQISPLLPAVMDYEGELALVALGDIDEPRLLAGVPQPFGLAACNDLTARICQVLGEGTDRTYDYWSLAKSFPGFLPIAPRVWSPAEGLARMPEIAIVTRVNGEERQHGSTKDLLYDLPTLIRAASTQLGRPLVRGDVVLTGTPAGIGLRLSAVKRQLAKLVKDRFRKAELLVSTYATSSALLRPGDVVEVDAGPAGSVRARLVV